MATTLDCRLIWAGWQAGLRAQDVLPEGETEGITVLEIRPPSEPGTSIPKRSSHGVGPDSTTFFVLVIKQIQLPH